VGLPAQAKPKPGIKFKIIQVDGFISFGRREIRLSERGEPSKSKKYALTKVLSLSEKQEVSSTKFMELSLINLESIKTSLYLFCLQSPSERDMIAEDVSPFSAKALAT
jgi:hypothetical protein